jgi:hypothetical protein
LIQNHRWNRKTVATKTSSRKQSARETAREYSTEQAQNVSRWGEIAEQPVKQTGNWWEGSGICKKT